MRKGPWVMNKIDKQLINTYKAEIKAKDKYIAVLRDLVQCLKDETQAYKVLLSLKGM